MPYARSWLPAAMALALGGCATAPVDRGMAQVRTALDARGIALPAEPGGGVSPWLEQPLTPESAMMVALARHPALQGAYARLGLAQADVIAASRPENPGLTLSAQESNAAGASMRLGYGLVQNFTDLLLLRARSDLAGAHLAQEKARVAEEIRVFALATRTAAVDAITLEQVARLRALVAGTAAAAAALASRFFEAGNISALQLAREQAAATDAALAQESARAAADAARWRLHRYMGLAATERGWTLHGGLPEPLVGEDPLPDLQILALASRLDLAALRGQAGTDRQAAELVRRWRWLPFLALGVDGERESDGEHLVGPTLSLELPVFRQGQDRVLRAEAAAELSAAGLAGLELDVAADVAVAYVDMESAARRARLHVERLIPQRETVVARLQELQNWMLAGQFDLILARQQEYDAYQGYLESVGDYWRARSALEHAVGAPLPSDSRVGPGIVGAPEPAPALPGDAHDHDGPSPADVPAHDGHHH